MPVLSEPQIEQWKNAGFVVAKVLDQDLIQKSEQVMKEKYPEVENACKDFGSNGELDFPNGTSLDQITLSESMIDSVKLLLGTEHILLVQSDAWSKAGDKNVSEFANKDQRMHMDYGNNTFCHPPPWTQPETVSVIVYLSDTKVTGGQTAVVRRRGDDDEAYQRPYTKMPGLAGLPWYNNRQVAEKCLREQDADLGEFRDKLYQREELALADLGDVLFYRLDIWHRGTPVKPGHVRYVMNLEWKKRDCYWICTWTRGWTQQLYYGWFEEQFAQMSPKQRETLGVPAVGDSYWTEEKLKFFKARFPSLDLTPYLRALHSSASQI